MKLKKIFSLAMAAVLLMMAGCGADTVQSASSIICSDAQSDGAQQSASFQDTPEDYAVQLTCPTLPVQAAYPDEGELEIVSESDFESAYESYDQKYSAWLQQRVDRLSQAEGNQDSLMAWWKSSMPVLLSGENAEDSENLIYSPINTYLACAMLAETVDGETRDQLLSALGADSIESLRKQANAVWNANYVDDGTVTSLLGSSLWLSEGLQYKQSALDAVTESYYASTFCGKMGSTEYNTMLQNWINEQTGGLLKDFASQLEFDPSTLLSLVSTIYYRAKWADTFDESSTTVDTFHGAAGDADASFMHQSQEGTYYVGDHFSAISRSLENSGEMVLILPDEGTTPEALTSDAQVMALLTDRDGYENQKLVMINESIPKFDVSSNSDLSEGMQQLGITDVFDAEKADFSPILEDSTQKAFLSQVAHAARVKIDEEGVEAAAYTAMMVCGTALPPDEEVDFVLNRPFLFVMLSDTGAPLFVGVVNQVSE